MTAASSASSESGERPVLRLEALSVRFDTGDGEVLAVRDFSLEVRRGECLGVVGESGAGKSQAFLATMGLLAANGRVEGRADFDGVDLLTLRGAELDRVRGARIGMVFQDPMTSLTPHIAVGDQIAEPIVRHLNLPWREARTRALELLKRVHVTDPSRRMTQYPHELSGGMRQRVMIAIALSCDPELLIADEPTTALDVTTQAQILALLAELKRDRGMAMVLITHDLGAVAGVADRVVVTRSGRIVETGSVREVMKAPREAYTSALVNFAGGVGTASETKPAAAVGGDGNAQAAMLGLSHVSVRFPIQRGWFQRAAQLRAVDDVSFALPAGEALGVVGESGSGKSTLARAALLLLRPHAGKIVWLGRSDADLESASNNKLKSLRNELQMVFQDPLASLDPRMTVGEIVAEPLRVHRPDLNGDDRSRWVVEMLVRVGLAPEMVNRYPHEFSGGQCQRIGIARAMVLKPRVLVCDEPVSALDVSTQEQILTLLADLKREYGLCILFVSHNLEVVRRLCERVLVLYLGRMMELAPASRLYTHPLHPYTRDLLEAVPIADPDVQPGRLARVRTGEPPSPLDPPSGCVYRTRCAYAIDVCSARLPAWEEVGEGGWVGCHRWREIGNRPP